MPGVELGVQCESVAGKTIDQLERTTCNLEELECRVRDRLGSVCMERESAPNPKDVSAKECVEGFPSLFDDIRMKYSRMNTSIMRIHEVLDRLAL